MTVRDVTRDRFGPFHGVPGSFSSLSLAALVPPLLNLAPVSLPIVDAHAFVEEPGFEERLNETGCVAGELGTGSNFFRAKRGEIS